VAAVHGLSEQAWNASGYEDQQSY